MKTILVLGMILLLNLSFVAADYGCKSCEGNNSSDDCPYKSFDSKIKFGHYGWGLLKVVYFALGVFLFSVIFWLTHNWLVKDKKKKKR